jgi:hypothetical protein
LSAEEVCSLHEQVRELENIISTLSLSVDTLAGVSERSVISQLEFFTSARSPAHKLFSHFGKEIKSIVREGLKDTSDRTILWMTAEECYKQATTARGSLHADNYFVPLEEAYLDGPDPDFESEEFDDHENLLAIDNDYAANFRSKAQRKSKVREDAHAKDEKAWIGFWLRALHSSQGGPTLF